MTYYNFHVPSLLAEAGLPPHSQLHLHYQPHQEHPPGPVQEVDHVVELQLVVAALNNLAYGTYTAFNWQGNLMDYFVEAGNLQWLNHEDNEAKGLVVEEWIQGNDISDADFYWIDMIQWKWQQIRQHMYNANQFNQFRTELDGILDI